MSLAEPTQDAAFALFDLMDESVAVFDRGGRIVYVNSSTERLFGRPRHELAGQILWELLPDAIGNPFHRAFQRVVSTSQASVAEHEYPPWGRWFLNRIYPWGELVCVMATDITAPRRAADQLEEARLQAETSAATTLRLQRLTATLAGSITVDDAAAALVRAGRAATGAESVYLWLMNTEGTHLRFVASAGTSVPVLPPYDAVEIGTVLPICDALKTGTILLFESPSDLALRYPLSAKSVRASSRAWAAVPLKLGDRGIGAATLAFAESRTFTTAERDLLAAMATQAALAVERCRLYDGEHQARQRAEEAVEQARRALERLRVLARVAGVIADVGTDIATVANTVAVNLTETVGDACMVYLLTDEGTRLRPLAVHDRDPQAALAAQGLHDEHPLTVKDSFLGQVVRSGQSLLVPQIEPALIEGTVMPAYRDFVARFPLRSLILTPLKTGGEVLGLLALVRRVPEQPYVSADRELAEDLAGRMAIAAVRARENRELESARERAQEGNRAKDEFLAMLGHELRNPLAPILTALELMRLRAPDTSAQERTVIERQVKHMVRLVDDLLDVSRITRGKITLAKTALELGEIVINALEGVGPLFEQRGQRLTTDLPRQGLMVEGDEERLLQVLNNLLTNAAKYTEPGGDVHVYARREDEQVVLGVRDSGMGIDPQLLPSIFDLFVQGQRAMDRSEGGMGLGLTIVRALVELHGGTVTARSEGVGKGSEFIVRLPRSNTIRAARPAEPAISGAPAAVRPRVLIVDDNVDAAEMLAEALGSLGFVTQVAHDGPQALAAAPGFRPALALVDIGLPVMDGYELAQRLKEAPDLSELKLVALTGYGQASDRAQAVAAGFHRHLVKPVDLATLEATVLELAPAT